MHQSKVYADPMNNGPGRILYTAKGFTDIPIIEGLEHIHKQAEETLENKYVTGGIEQYNLYHILLKEKITQQNLFENNIVIFVASTTVNQPRKETVSEELSEFSYEPKYYPSIKRGLDVTSNMNYFGSQLMELDSNLEQLIEEEMKSGAFSKTERGILYVPVAPLVTINKIQETVENIYNDEVVNVVSATMINRNKKPMGSTSYGEGFEHPLYVYMPSFFDADKAMNIAKLPEDMHPREFRQQLLEHTRYNRIVTSYMYSELMNFIPGEEIYVYSTKTSFLYDIAERAAKRASKKIHEVVLMRNETLPQLAESETSARRIVENYLATQILGKRQQLTMKDLF